MRARLIRKVKRAIIGAITDQAFVDAVTIVHRQCYWEDLDDDLTYVWDELNAHNDLVDINSVPDNLD